MEGTPPITLHEAEAFFRKELADVDEPTIPFGVPNEKTSRHAYQQAVRDLDPALISAVRIESQRLGVSVASLFHAACGIVVARTAGRADVVFGSVLLEQARNPTCLNPLPLRMRMAGISAADLVRRTQQQLADTSAYVRFPLQAALRCAAADASTPLFTTLFDFRSDPLLQQVEAPTGAISPLHEVEYALMLAVIDRGEHVLLKASTDDRIDSQRVVEYLRTAIEALTQALQTAPQTPALALSVLPANERRQLTDLFNRTFAAYEDDKLVHQLVERQVQATPHSIAVVHDAQSLTYGELDRRANQWADFLRDRQVGPDSLVGLCVERGLDMVVTLLGILKAGGAYLPLDPAYPTERLACMLADARPRVVVLQEKLRSALPQTDIELVAVDAPWTRADRPFEHSTRDAKRLTSESLAYVIFTSGSTGRPKGTAMPHRAVVNLLEWHRHTLPLNPGDRVLQFAALSFDVAFQEIFSTLALGGTLVMLNEATRKNPQALGDLLIHENIQRLFLPPLALQSLAEHFKTAGNRPSELRDVITAGEQLRISPEVSALFVSIQPCRLHNHYGPTETHVVTALELPADPNIWPTLPSIGRPISNARIYLLDEYQQPVPSGVAGEIYIGGVSVARGYLERPELTQQRFLEDPFSSQPGARMYRTGDLGKYQDDGTLEYLGRNDHQVKIRGYRIELGEIEAALVQHPLIKEGAVVAREDAPGQKRLIAYVICRSVDPTGSAPTVEDMRTHLKSMLPQYMVPTAFVRLEQLPLTPNGKLDRRALPAPRFNDYVRAEYEAPQGEVETGLARIWQHVLRIEKIGREDDFFELGGDSLTAMTVLERISERFLVQMPFHSTFLHPTLRQMAQFVHALSEQERTWAMSNKPEYREGVI